MGKYLHDPIAYAAAHAGRVARLRARSYYWPAIYTNKNDRTIIYSTLVRIFREGKWYVVHLVYERAFDIDEPVVETIDNYLLLIERVHNIQYLFKLSPECVLDDLQDSEEKRMSDLLEQSIRRR